MYDFSVQVNVLVLEPNRRIRIEWSAYGAPTTVEWVFTSRADGTTFVTVTNAGFSGDAAQVVSRAIEGTEGFALALAGLKALLEHGVVLNLVTDRFPDGIGGH
jgi:uncharacterized protein YndB with AHSA1/START domain